MESTQLNKTVNEWTAEEDERFTKQIQICGTHNWKIIAEHFAGKSAKHCRLRWHNHLNPDIKRIGWSREEDQILLQYHRQLGNKWARVSLIILFNYLNIVISL